VNKKIIIIAAAGGLVSFSSAFLTVWLVGRSHAAALAVQAKEQEKIKAEAQAKGAVGTNNEGEGHTAALAGSPEGEDLDKGLSEKQLKSLIFEVREKIHVYEEKSKELDVRETRLAIIQDSLKKDIEELNKMKVETATLIAALKEQRSRLLETRAVIEQGEKANLTAIAATYDKMDSSSASKIMSNMCTKQMESGKLQGGSIDDAVKILYYMTERTKAKVLAEMVNTEPKLAALLCQRLKVISEGK
jgi:flagellar motility protein MotE (MotC chaperone)